MLPLRTVPPLRWEGCHCEAVAQMAVPAWPHLRIIWTQIVYLVFLKCYQCFLCAFVSPLQKENSPPPSANPPPKNDTSLRAMHRFPHDHQQNGVQINPQDTFHPHPRFPPGCPSPEMCRAPTQRGNSNKLRRRKRRDAGACWASYSSSIWKENLTSCNSAFIFVCCCQHRRQSCHLLTSVILSTI